MSEKDQLAALLQGWWIEWRDAHRSGYASSELWRWLADRLLVADATSALRVAAKDLIATLDEEDGDWWWQEEAERLRDALGPIG